jgi:hypothetical protein
VSAPSLDDVEYLEGELVIPTGLPYAEWERLGELLKFRRRNIGFWIGDWYNWGQEHYGEKFSQALDETGYAKHTIQNAASVAKAIPPSRRRNDVPFGYHAEVAALPPKQADRLLAEASKTVMPRAQLRAKVRHLRAVEQPAPDRYCWTVACSTCRSTGPVLDYQPGHLQLDRGAVGGWLADHQHHDVRLVGEDMLEAWQTEQLTGAGLSG